jgi:hypothetical protein
MSMQPSSLSSEESLQYPDLRYLVRSYFDQDWDVVSDDPDEILAAFRDEEQVETVLAVIKDTCSFIVRFGVEDIALGKAFDTIFEPQISFYNWHYRESFDGLMKVVQILSEKKAGAIP